MTTRDRTWWRDAANVIGVAGILIALIGTAIGVWIQVGQTRDSRFYAQLAVLTQLASEARPSDRALTSPHVLRMRCDKHYHRSDLLPSEQQSLNDSLDVYEVMAWVFNHDLAPESARELWGPRLVDIRAEAIKLNSPGELRNSWGELASFDQHGIRAYDSPCPG